MWCWVSKRGTHGSLLAPLPLWWKYRDEITVCLSLVQAVLAGCLGFHAALTSKAVDSGWSLAGAAASIAAGGPAPAASSCGSGSGSASSGSDAERAKALCRSLSAMHTLGALCALCPEAVAQRLPPQLAPLFAPRIQPVLLRALRYLALFSDRWEGGPHWRAEASAALLAGSGGMPWGPEPWPGSRFVHAQAQDAETEPRATPPTLQPCHHPCHRPCRRRRRRFSLAACGDVRTVASALVKLGSGSAVLRNELNLDAVLQQVGVLRGDVPCCAGLSALACGVVCGWASGLRRHRGSFPETGQGSMLNAMLAGGREAGTVTNSCTAAAPPDCQHACAGRPAPQAQQLDEAAQGVLPGALRHEDGATLAGAGASLTIQRIWHLLRCAGGGAEL